MTIDEKMIVAVDELVANFGTGYIASRKEIISLLHNKYGVNEGSIIPSDYCYNRINDGIALSKPTLFEYMGSGQYRCLGECYPFNGIVLHKDQVVGKCENGERRIFGITETNVQPASRNEKIQNGRTPSPRLRFEVLARDKFTCRFCGASPTKDPETTLHIDHIIPWAKGGKTTRSNLQTLCSKCNLGKSDIIVE